MLIIKQNCAKKRIGTWTILFGHKMWLIPKTTPVFGSDLLPVWTSTVLLLFDDKKIHFDYSNKLSVTWELIVQLRQFQMCNWNFEWPRNSVKGTIYVLSIVKERLFALAHSKNFFDLFFNSFRTWFLCNNGVFPQCFHWIRWIQWQNICH